MISTIITAFNSERYLARAIKSVVAQKFSFKSEIIVINDGSTDKTEEIAKSYKNINYYAKNNGGPSSARNLGINKSNYDLICFLDADDYWEPNKLKFQVESFNKNKEASIFTCNSNIIKNDSIVGTLNNPEKVFLKKNLKSGIVKNYLRKNGRYNFHQPSSIMVKKELFEKYGFFSDKYIGVEDSEIFMRWVLNDEIIYYQNDILSNYETSNPNSLTKNFSSWSKNHFSYWMDLEDKIPENSTQKSIFFEMRKNTLLSSIFVLIKNFQPLLARNLLLKHFTLLFSFRWIYIFLITLIPNQILKITKYVKNLYYR